MTSTEFYKLVLALWGEDWRPRLLVVLAEHGHSYTRQTLWNWRKGHTPIPNPVVAILKREAEYRGTCPGPPTSPARSP